MATKQELEARIAELEASLAANATPVDQRVAELELNMAQALEREKSVAEHANSLQDENEGLQAENSSLENQISTLQAQLRILSDARVVPITLPTEAVVLGGVKHDIVEQGRMLDLVDQWRKRFIQDDDLVLVVKKA